jgi:arylmalonate decarboxylase
VTGVNPSTRATAPVDSGPSRRVFLKVGAAAATAAGLGFSAEPAVGLIFPASSPAVPGEAQMLYPAGVGFRAEGVGLGRTLPEDFDRLTERVLAAAHKLSAARVNAIVLMAPPLSFYKGAAFNRRLTDEMTRATGLPSITASSAIVEGLKDARARRVAVATVYTDEISLRLQGFLEESGFEVVTVKGLGIERFEERPPVMDTVTKEEWLEFCVKVRESRPEADSLLICGGYLATLDLIVPIEKRCQIPVVAATPQALRSGARLAGLGRRVL